MSRDERAVSITNSQALRYKLDLVMPALLAPTRGVLNRPKLYPAVLARLCCVAQSFIPLLDAALTRARAIADDPVATELAPYLEKHITEEAGEDMMADLEVLGYVRPDVLRDMPLASIAALVGAQYYWIHHCHPVSVLGYIQVLEGYPPSKEIVEELIARTGLPRAAFQSLLHHAELDLRHRDELHELLDGLPLDRDLGALLGVSALHTARMLSEIFGELFPGEGSGDGDGRIATNREEEDPVT